jgi:hypothetical protein
VEGMHRIMKTDLKDILGKLMPSKPENNKLVSISDEKIRAGFKEGCPYKCGICGNIFYTLHRMKIHYGVHDKSLKNIWTCKLCLRKEHRKDLIYEHVKRAHKKHGLELDICVSKMRGSEWEKFSTDVDSFLNFTQIIHLQNMAKFTILH